MRYEGSATRVASGGLKPAGNAAPALQLQVAKGVQPNAPDGANRRECTAPLHGELPGYRQDLHRLEDVAYMGTAEW